MTTTTTKTRTKKAVPADTCNTFLTAGVRYLRIVKDGKTYLYHLASLDSDWGTAFRLTELAEESDVYDVMLDGPEGTTCECLGFLRWRKPCKHLKALRALVADGRIPSSK